MKVFLKSPIILFITLVTVSTTFFILIYLTIPNFWTELLIKYSVSLSGILSIYILYGKNGIFEILSKIFKWRINPLWYLLALLIPIFSFTNLAKDTENSFFFSFGVVILALLSKIFLGGGLGEELGWRGFAFPHLLKTNNFIITNLIIGIVWALWHFPKIYVFNMPAQMYFIYLIGCIILSFILGWIYLRTDSSLLVCILFHAGVNVPFELSKYI